MSVGQYFWIALLALPAMACQKTSAPIDLQRFASIAKSKVSPDAQVVAVCGHYAGKRFFSGFKAKAAGEWERVNSLSRAFAIFRSDEETYDVVIMNINDEIVSAASYFGVSILHHLKSDRSLSLSVIYPSDGNMENYLVFKRLDGTRHALFGQTTTTVPSITAVEADCLN